MSIPRRSLKDVLDKALEAYLAGHNRKQNLMGAEIQLFVLRWLRNTNS